MFSVPLFVSVEIYVQRMYGSVVVKVLCYKPDCRGFETR
jgi:hypothetical protein